MTDWTDSLMKENKAPDVNATYLYDMEYVHDAVNGRSTKIPANTIVYDVRRLSNKTYRFKIVGDEKTTYRSNYSWAFVLNTPENLKALEIRNDLRNIATAAIGAAEEAAVNVQTLELK